MGDPSAALLFVVCVAYACGVRHAWIAAGPGRVVHRREVACFAAGALVAGVALASPLDTAAGSSLVAHMAQHVLLLAVAPPLLAMGGVIPALVSALPRSRRAHVRRVWRGILRLRSPSRHQPAWTIGALVLQAAGMWVWHAPTLYDAAVRSAPVHALEHLTFLLSATLFWWLVAGERPARRGAAALTVFAAGLPGTALGAALLLAPHPWYPSYARGPAGHALADQQLAGVVMWAAAGLAYVVVAAALVGTWLADAERRSPGNVGVLAPPVGAVAQPTRPAR